MFEQFTEEARNVVIDAHPFTQPTKRVLELALREALSRGDRHIGAEHLLLSLTCERADDLAMRLLAENGITPAKVRAAIEAAPPVPEPQGGNVVASSAIGRVKQRGMPAPTPIAVDFSAEARRLMMSAAARAPDDGRTLITISDLEEALRRWHDADDAPPESATG